LITLLALMGTSLENVASVLAATKLRLLTPFDTVFSRASDIATSLILMPMHVSKRNKGPMQNMPDPQ
jgi:hypothetical protein